LKIRKKKEFEGQKGTAGIKRLLKTGGIRVRAIRKRKEEGQRAPRKGGKKSQMGFETESWPLKKKRMRGQSKPYSDRGRVRKGTERGKKRRRAGDVCSLKNEEFGGVPGSCGEEGWGKGGQCGGGGWGRGWGLGALKGGVV